MKYQMQWTSFGRAVPSSGTGGHVFYRTIVGGRAEQDYFKILNLGLFDVLVTLLAGKIPIGNVLFLSSFQDIHFQNLDLVSFSSKPFENITHIMRYSRANWGKHM
jgi:hypothetical protein